ncbi:DUF6000 family protein [Streptomyces goshikiensis]|uniref:DUF6000 family protein n=1 Tax=Streptomyces goshikiensis TaxID=1942 RepID=UPI00366637F7
MVDSCGPSGPTPNISPVTSSTTRPRSPTPSWRPSSPTSGAHLGTHHADHFTEPGGPWNQWVNALPHLHDHPAYTPAERHRSTDLQCDFANGWTRP